jgi:cytochrome c556
MRNARQQSFPLLRSLIVATALVGGGAGIMAVANAADAPFILADVMNNVVMGSSDGLWQSVVLDDVAPDGKETYTGPTTDEDWEKLRASMQSLAEAGAQLQKLPEGWQVQDPSLKYETPPGDLSPDAVAALIKKESAAWNAHAEVLRTAAEQAVKAAEAHDLNTLGALSDSLDGICESCHLQFWYPEQAKPAA